MVKKFMALTMMLLFMPVVTSCSSLLSDTATPTAARDTASALVSTESVRTIRFSGYDWMVKSSPGRVGPGPNYFSGSSNNVWVDLQGRLHMRITFSNGRWYCAEVGTRRSLGYGAYRFYLDSPVDNLDPNAVLGLFTWSDDPAYNNREIDIEFSRWGDATNTNNAQYVVQPWDLPQHLLRFPVPSGMSATTHSFTWSSNRVYFRSLKGHYRTPPSNSYILRQWTFTGSGVPKAGGENARIKLWLMNGDAPTEGKTLEVIIKKFEFVPMIVP